MRPLLELDSLSLSVSGDGAERTILDHVSLTVGPGESLGIVGESGSGKSMLLRTISRLLPPGCESHGRAIFEGADLAALTGAALRAYRVSGIGMIFQDARSALNPLQKVGQFLIEPAILRGESSRTSALAAAAEMLEQVGFADPTRSLHQYPMQLSGGMLQRVMIASVLLARPKLILADEPTTALDVTTQSDVLALLDELRRTTGSALVLVTHDLDLTAAVCDRIAVMYAGSIQELRTGESLIREPMHPYTRALLQSRPDITRRHGRLPAIPGRPVAAYEAPSGCVFRTRCPYATSECASHRPNVTAVADGMVRCFRLAALPPATTNASTTNGQR